MARGNKKAAQDDQADVATEGENESSGQEVATETPAAAAKKKAEAEVVTMQDGREVAFAGKRKMVKETIINEELLEVTEDSITLRPGAVQVRIDFRNGQTVQFTPPLSMIPKATGHGLEQKLGDETAGEDKIDDMVLAVESLVEHLNSGDWRRVAEQTGGFSGASVVIKAIMEASGKSQEDVKKFLQGKITAAEAKGEKLSRKDLYASFRNPNSKTGQIIERLEREERAKASKVDADKELADFMSGGQAEAA